MNSFAAFRPVCCPNAQPVRHCSCCCVRSVRLRFPRRPMIRPVELLGWLELPLDDSPVLVLIGFNEGRIPESINADAFMPNSLRTRLELTDNRRRYARDAYALTAVMHSRRRLVLIAGRTDVKGNPRSHPVACGLPQIRSRFTRTSSPILRSRFRR
jgi:hypothetical protein